MTRVPSPPRTRGTLPRFFLRTPLLPLAMALIPALAPVPAASQADGDPIVLGSYRVLHSNILGEDRVLQVHLPRGYESGDGSYPVVFVFYAESLEGYFTQTVNDLYHLSMDRMPPALLVGIPNTQRYRDLLPWAREGAMGEEGRADRFLAFVQQELIPFVEREYRTKPYRILVGPQAAAVFGVYALLEAPGTFQAFVLNDPCVADDEGRSLCRELVAYAATPPARGLYFAVSHGEGSNFWSPQRLETLRQGLAREAVQGFRWRIEIDTEWPFFLAPVRTREALLDLFAAYPFPTPDQARSLEQILSHYQEVGEDLGLALEPPDLVLTLAGNAMMERGDHPAALETMTRLVELYPSSMNGLWGMANLHRSMGDTATALRYYRECLERDPSMGPAREWIRRLGGGG